MKPGTDVILGISGGIAAYKAADLASKLTQAGASVHTVMTRSATAFIAPLTFQSISGNPVYVDMFEAPRQWSVEHIALADRARLLLVAPATANVLGKFAAGIADDYLSTLYLAVPCPVLVCPAMNYRMWAHPAVQTSVSTLRQRGVLVMEPEEGRLASGATGLGRLPSPEDILSRALEVLNPSPSFSGFSVLVTAGPTREYVDPVRFLSNPSTGKMGYAIARCLRNLGARVVLVSGPTSLQAPDGVEMVPVTSAADMHREVMNRLSGMDAVVKAAAVSDFRPASTSDHKIRKDHVPQSLPLERNQDILLEIGKEKGSMVLVGFAAQTGHGEDEARRKLSEKNLDLVVYNRVDEPGSGFGSDTNRAVIYRASGLRDELPLSSKDEVAKRLCEHLHFYLMDRRSRTGGGEIDQRD